MLRGGAWRDELCQEEQGEIGGAIGLLRLSGLSWGELGGAVVVDFGEFSEVAVSTWQNSWSF